MCFDYDAFLIYKLMRTFCDEMVVTNERVDLLCQINDDKLHIFNFFNCI